MADSSTEPGPAQHAVVDALGEQFSLRLDMVAAMLPPANPDRPLKKAVQAIHSYPTNGLQTVTTRKLLNALVVHAQDVFAKMAPDDRQAVKAVRGTPVFRIPIKRLLALMGSEASNNYERIYAALDSIFQWDIRWNLMGDTPSGTEIIEEVTSRFISQYSKGVGDRIGMVSYEFPYDVLTLLMEPHPYALLDLRTVNQLGSSYAIALYESCARYLGTANRVTAALAVEEWINIIAGVGKYNGKYKDFNKFALKPAMKWLETVDSCPFTVEPRVVYGPRKRVVGLQFKMHLKRQQSLAVEMPPTWDPRTIDVLKKVYQMPEKDIILMSRMASEAEVQEAMSRDSAMIARKSKAGEAVSNRAKYLQGILRNIQLGRPKDQEPEADAEELASKSVQDAMAKVKKKQEEFAEFRKSRFREQLLELPESALDDLKAEFSAAKANEGLIGQWLRAGWSKPHPGLMSSFVTWVMSTKSDIVERMLTKPEEKEFAVWMMLNAGDE
jgi:hypothetical protein